jgi:hypothetical protein
MALYKPEDLIGKLRSSDQAVLAPCQHTKPCPDCPFARKALRGWLGGDSSQEWISNVRTDDIMPCHVFKNQQCAGASIYRRHIAKSSRNPKALVLPANHELVFSDDSEFTEHHNCFKKSDA